MKKYIFIICITIYSLFASGQKMQNSPIYFNNDGLTLDSLYDIVFNQKTSCEEKLKIFMPCSYIISSDQIEKQEAVLNNILEDCKKNKDYDGAVYMYTALASHYYAWNNSAMFNLYADSTDTYAENIWRSKTLLYYYYTKGYQNFKIPYGRKECFSYYEKAIDCIYDSEIDEDAAGSIIYNIIGDITLKPDTAFMERICRKVETYLLHKYNPSTEISLCWLKSELFKYRYNEYKREEMLDSTIYYGQKLIDVYNKSGTNNESDLYYVTQVYLLIAGDYSLKSNPDYETVSKYINKVKETGDTSDLYVASLLHYTEALYDYSQKKYANAEKHIVQAESFLKRLYEEEEMYTGEFSGDEINQADMHTKILYSLGRYEEASKYNRKKNKIKINVRDEETRELEYLYRTDKEERKIEQLKIESYSRRRSYNMFISIAIMLIVIFFMLLFWFYTSKKNLEKRSKIIKAEKEKAELNMKIQEEQEFKAQLEKYEILSDFKIKASQLEEKDRQLEMLIKEKDELDKKIAEYTQRLNKYKSDDNEEDEKNAQTEDDSANTINRDSAILNIAIEDINSLIKRKLNKKSEYINVIKQFDETYISALQNTYNGKLSIQYIKYCICFAMGLNAGDIAQCFSIEPTSVHMIRYRLKKKFGLANSDDLDLFLQRLNSNSAALIEAIKKIEKYDNKQK